jgi:hypothetical protein
MSDPLACPYCNALVTAAPGTAAGQRISCPRCGETFTLRQQVPTSVQPASSVVGVTSSPPATLRPTPEEPATDSFRFKVKLLSVFLLLLGGILLAMTWIRLGYQGSLEVLVLLGIFSAMAFFWVWFFRVPRSNRTTALFLLANMVLVAAVGLVGGLATQKDRRAHDAGLPRRPRRWPVPDEPIENSPLAATTAPHRLPALGYLPPGTSVVAGVHVAELLESQTGKQLLADPLKVADVELRLGSFEHWTGLKLADLDHVVLGVKIEDPFPPRSYLVARTRHPYDLDKIRKVLKAQRLGGGRRTLYSFEPQGMPLPLVLWCASERTLVVGLLADHLKALPDTPHEGLEQLPEEVRTILKERVGPVGPLWAAGHADHWERTAAGALLERLKQEDRVRLRSIQTFAIWMQLDQSVTVTGVFHCHDHEAAHALDDFLQTRRRGATLALKSVQDDAWLTVQLRTDLAAVRRALEK